MNARWILQPRVAYHDPIGGPEAGTGPYLWWAITDVAIDESCLWAAAIAAGLLLARTGDGGEKDEWTTRHRARMLTLIAVGTLSCLAWWPGELLLTGAATALLLSGVLRSPVAAPWGVALIAGSIPLVLAAKGLIEWQTLVRDSGQAAWDAFALSNDSFDAWESASWSGNAAARSDARSEALGWAFGRMLPERWLWQAGSGILLGCWWARAGHKTLAGRLHGQTLTHCGLILTATAVSLVAWTYHDSLTLRVADLATYSGGCAIALGATVWLHTGDNGTLPQTTGTRILAAVGRGALTAHLATTAALAATAQGWGLGLHGSLGPGAAAGAGAGAAALAAGTGWWAGRHGPGTFERWWTAGAERLVAAARS